MPDYGWNIALLFLNNAFLIVHILLYGKLDTRNHYSFFHICMGFFNFVLEMKCILAILKILYRAYIVQALNSMLALFDLLILL